MSEANEGLGGEGDWNCEVCTFVNNTFCTECQMCQAVPQQAQMSFQQSEEAMRQAILMSLRESRQEQQQDQEVPEIAEPVQTPPMSPSSPEPVRTPSMSPLSPAISPLSPLSVPASLERPVRASPIPMPAMPEMHQGNHQSFFSLIADYLTRRGIAFQEKESSFHIPVKAKNSSWLCIIQVESCIVTASSYYRSEGEEILPAVGMDKIFSLLEFVTRANPGVPSGFLDLDLNNGQLRFRTELWYSNIDSEQLRLYLPGLLDVNLDTFVRYLPGIDAMRDGATPSEALKAITGSGETIKGTFNRAASTPAASTPKSRRRSTPKQSPVTPVDERELLSPFQSPRAPFSPFF